MAKILCVAIVAVIGVSAAAKAGTITFDEGSVGLVHGSIVSTQYSTTHGVTFSGINLAVPDKGTTFDLVVAFNSAFGGSTTDPDLLGPPEELDWDGGNLAGHTPPVELGNVLIIPENIKDNNNDGILDDPDDEADHPAGRFIIDFANPIDSFGFDLIDVEQNEVSGGYFAAFFMGGSELANVGFGKFTDNASIFYDSTVVFGGNNTANRLDPITAAELTSFTGNSIQQFDRVVLQLGGSGAIDTIQYTVVPVPASAKAGLSLLALLAVGAAWRKVRQRDSI